MATNTLDFASWNFSNVQLAPVKLKLTGEFASVAAGLAAETAARIAADNAEAIVRAAADAGLQTQINELGQSFAHSMLLGGM